MKVRTKFTMWIALASCFAAILFSTFVYVEVLEEMHKLIKRELLDTGHAILKQTNVLATQPFHPEKTDYPLERYYIKLFVDTSTLLYTSPLASMVDIPPPAKDGWSTLTRELSPEKIWLDPMDKDDEEELTGNKTRFKVRRMSKMQNERLLTLVIAKPLAMMSMELTELIFELLLYIIITILLIVLISYYLAGKLLQPISDINSKIRAIRETSLDERIPLGRSEDELYTLSVSLNSMFDRLQGSFKRQKEFISSASHEMKIPLTIATLGHEQMLAKNLPDTIRQELQKQLFNLRRLNKLVKDLLDLSHLEHKEYIERSNINLSALILQTLEDFKEMLEASDITCRTEIEQLSLNIDRDKMVRVFINLIDNAIKYNLPEGGTLEITARQTNQKIKISITNTSFSIPPEDLPNLFNQFYRVEKSRAAKYGGSGLGLTLVKRIIELHGGTIQAASSDGKTRFNIIIPA